MDEYVALHAVSTRFRYGIKRVFFPCKQFARLADALSSGVLLNDKSTGTCTLTTKDLLHLGIYARALLRLVILSIHHGEAHRSTVRAAHVLL